MNDYVIQLLLVGESLCFEIARSLPGRQGITESAVSLWVARTSAITVGVCFIERLFLFFRVQYKFFALAT